MIDDSQYWKRDLRKMAATMGRWKTKRRWGDPSLARLEQTVMLGFYSIRKLAEAAKLSTATVRQNLSLISYPCLGKTVTLMNRHKLDELYDFGAGRSVSRDVMFLCHQIVHSYVFSPLFNDRDRLQGILFNSDRQRHESLFCLDVDRLVALLDEVARDYPARMEMHFNATRSDYDVLSG